MADLELLAQPSEVEGTYEPPPHGWVCFHCGDEFSVAKQKSLYAAIAAATEHFGEDPRWEPMCIMRARLAPRKMARSLRLAEAQVVDLIADRERLEGELSVAKAGLSRIAGATSAHEAFCAYDSMEGRALTAEAIVSAAEQLAPVAIALARAQVVGETAQHEAKRLATLGAHLAPGEVPHDVQ